MCSWNVDGLKVYPIRGVQRFGCIRILTARTSCRRLPFNKRQRTGSDSDWSCMQPVTFAFAHALRAAFRLLAMAWLLAAMAGPRAETITYPQSGSAGDARDSYPLKLLQLAFDKADASAKYSLKVSDMAMPQGRALTELAQGSGVRVVWSMTSIRREADLLPIRIPIFKGLIGWRLPLVRADHADALATVHDLADLRHFSAGQGHDWPDTEILRGNGIPVIDVPLYDSLFGMLALGRFDYFPRSVHEIWAEEELHRKDGIVIDQHLLVRYPSAFYFFVNKKDTVLAETVRSGLERAIADGSFDKLFCLQFAQKIAKARLAQRTTIELFNPILPPETPLARKELWFSADLCSAGK